MRIIGVDFSGAQDQKKSDTWLAQGRLEGNVLTLETCHPIIRADLTDHLAALEGPAAVGMDFPFSVPAEFAKRRLCYDKSWEMPDLWAATRTKGESFKKAAKQFWKKHNGQKKQQQWLLRKCDQQLFEFDPKSPLKPEKTGNPAMLPMTYQGMRLLGCLWDSSRVKVSVLPLPNPSPHGLGPPLTLLEVMPGATLQSLNLLPDHDGYKGGKDALRKRQNILTALPNQVEQLGLNLAGLPDDLTQTCRANDDALDAVVAAVTAALWCIGVPAKIDPADCPESLLEGWMYVPQRANQ